MATEKDSEKSSQRLKKWQTPPDAKYPKLPSFTDGKDELNSYLLRFERYAANASLEKDTWAIELSAL